MPCCGCKTRGKLAARAWKKCRGKQWRIKDQDQDPICFGDRPSPPPPPRPPTPPILPVSEGGDLPLGSTRRSWVFFSTSSWVVQQNRAQSRLLYLFYDKEQLNSPHIPLFFISKRTSVVSMFYTLYHKARFFNKSECALYVNFIIEMQNKTVLITRTKVRLDTTLRD